MRRAMVVAAYAALLSLVVMLGALPAAAQTKPGKTLLLKPPLTPPPTGGTVTSSPAPPSTKIFTIVANDFYNKATQYGYNSYAHKKSWNADCTVGVGGRDHGGSAVTVWSGGATNAVGSTCDFSLFEGALKNGFRFHDFIPGSPSSSDPAKAQTTLTRKPSAGESNANFKYHGWAESFQITHMGIETILLEGPSALTWDRAFH